MVVFKLRQKIVQKNLTVVEFASLCGFSRKHYYEILRKEDCTLSEVRKMSEVLSLSNAEIIDIFHK